MSENEAGTGTIGWIDLTIENAEAIRDFYGDVVGWKSSAVDMGGYSDFVMTTPSGENPAAGVCHARGTNVGLPAQWLIYIVVDNLDESVKRCRELGGEIVREPRAMGGQGRYSVIRDPAGAVSALFEPAK